MVLLYSSFTGTYLYLLIFSKKFLNFTYLLVVSGLHSILARTNFWLCAQGHPRRCLASQLESWGLNLDQPHTRYAIPVCYTIAPAPGESF